MLGRTDGELCVCLHHESFRLHQGMHTFFIGIEAELVSDEIYPAIVEILAMLS